MNVVNLWLQSLADCIPDELCKPRYSVYGQFFPVIFERMNCMIWLLDGCLNVLIHYLNLLTRIMIAQKKTEQYHFCICMHHAPNSCSLVLSWLVSAYFSLFPLTEYY